MEKDPQEDYESLRQRFEDRGQGHIFKYYDEYTQEEKDAFLDQCRQVDLDEIERLYKDVCKKDHGDEHKDQEIKPLDRDSVHTFGDLDEDTQQKWRLRGAREIMKGKVALMILAGGMGSRLGSNDPKGMYDIGLPSHKSLFQIISERFQRAQSYSAEICQKAGENCAPRFKCMFYVMTSDLNDKQTRNFFQSHDYFGIPEDRVLFFKQSSLPTLTFEGKLMLETRKTLSLGPNGNGALFEALRTNKDLQNSINENGVEFIHLVGVDNSLNKFLDPLQVGMTYEKGLKGSSKFIQKKYPTESIGVFVKRGDTVDLIEYSELGESMAKETFEDGTLKYNQGNIVNFLIEVETLNSLVFGKAEVLNSLYHCAVKKIPEYDESTDSSEKPSKENGYKLELFVHSFLSYVEGAFEMIEGIREEEFAPVKNKEGEDKDSPTTAREMISKLHASWIKKACPDVEFKEEPSSEFVVELPFLGTYEGENVSEAMIPKDVLKN
jgi:UDP-N-acetylglucosamine/UDP-N-acetylgalactosamine diphosphorylase